MRVVLVTYSDAAMTRSKELCCDSALRNGCTHAWAQSPDTISYEFKDFNKDIWQHGNRGADCFWLFKPYVIYKAMQLMTDGETLIYSDAGQEFVGPIQPIINAMQGDIMLFSNGWPHVEWCKWDCIETIMPGCYTQRDMVAVNHKQIQASLQIYRISKQSRDFVKEWLIYCQMPGLIDDSPSVTPNYPTFADHRHDQAILSCVAHKYSIKGRWFPTLTNMHQQQPGDNYPAIINHHRKRDPGKGAGQPEW